MCSMCAACPKVGDWCQRAGPAVRRARGPRKRKRALLRRLTSPRAQPPLPAPVPPQRETLQQQQQQRWAAPLAAGALQRFSAGFSSSPISRAFQPWQDPNSPFAAQRTPANTVIRVVPQQTGAGEVAGGRAGGQAGGQADGINGCRAASSSALPAPRWRPTAQQRRALLEPSCLFPASLG